MWYAITGVDVADSLPLRQQHRAAHLARIQELVDEGRVLLAGPHPQDDSPEPGEAGFSGSLMIVKFESLVEAQAWAAQDPYMLGGVFVSVSVKPFVPVLP